MRPTESPMKGSVVQDHSCLMNGSCKGFPPPTPQARGQWVRIVAHYLGEVTHLTLVAKSMLTRVTLTSVRRS